MGRSESYIQYSYTVSMIYDFHSNPEINIHWKNFFSDFLSISVCLYLLNIIGSLNHDWEGFTFKKKIYYTESWKKWRINKKVLHTRITLSWPWFSYDIIDDFETSSFKNIIEKNVWLLQ